MQILNSSELHKPDRALTRPSREFQALLRCRTARRQPRDASQSCHRARRTSRGAGGRGSTAGLLHRSIGQTFRARSRLYRSQILRINLADRRAVRRTARRKPRDASQVCGWPSVRGTTVPRSSAPRAAGRNASQSQRIIFNFSEYVNRFKGSRSCPKSTHFAETC